MSHLPKWFLHVWQDSSRSHPNHLPECLLPPPPLPRLKARTGASAAESSGGGGLMGRAEVRGCAAQFTEVLRGFLF